MSRVDEVILLFTGEQPGPNRKSSGRIHPEHEACLRTSGRIVLEVDRHSPILVIELDALEAKSEGSVINKLWPGIDAVNARTVEYVRRKEIHISIIKGTTNAERLPHSAKEHTIRSSAEILSVPILTRIVEDSRARRNCVDLPAMLGTVSKIKAKSGISSSMGLSNIGVDSLLVMASWYRCQGRCVGSVLMYTRPKVRLAPKLSKASPILCFRYYVFEWRL